MDVSVLPLSQVTKVPLLDRAGDRLGRVDDLIVRLADGGYPPITGLKAQIGGREVFVPVERVSALEPGRVQLSGEKLDLGRFERRPGEVLLRADILGRRLINVVGARLVRANEIELAAVGGRWRVVGVDASLRSMLRNLLSRRSRADAPGPFLDWASIEPFVAHVPSAGLRVPYAKLARLHPAQLADLVEAASHEEGQEIINAVSEDRELEADVFEELDAEHQVEFLRRLSDAEAAKILGRMAPDDVADVIIEMDQERRAPILALLPAAHERKVRTLLGYHPFTAGGLMSPDFLALGGATSVGTALERAGRAAVAHEALTMVFAIDDEGRLVGAAPLARLLGFAREVPLSEVIDTDPPRLRTDADLPELARLMTDYNMTVAPVVDEGERLVGVVTVDDLLEIILPSEWRRRAEALGDD